MHWFMRTCTVSIWQKRRENVDGRELKQTCHPLLVMPRAGSASLIAQSDYVMSDLKVHMCEGGNNSLGTRI